MIVQQKQGNLSIRTFILAAHIQSQALQICTYSECKQSSRWACAGCMKADVHKHNSCNQEFLMDQDEFFQHLEQKKHDLLSNNEQQYQNIENITQMLTCLSNEISALIKTLQIIEQTKNNNKELQQLEQTISQIKSDFYQLLQMNKLVKLFKLTIILSKSSYNPLTMSTLKSFQNNQQDEIYKSFYQLTGINCIQNSQNAKIQYQTESQDISKQNLQQTRSPQGKNYLNQNQGQRIYDEPPNRANSMNRSENREISLDSEQQTTITKMYQQQTSSVGNQLSSKYNPPQQKFEYQNQQQNQPQSFAQQKQNQQQNQQINPLQIPQQQSQNQQQQFQQYPRSSIKPNKIGQQTQN
ncbi:hypothetical protein pb186bvf_018319 [Paramecium bursaria]